MLGKKISFSSFHNWKDNHSICCSNMIEKHFITAYNFILAKHLLFTKEMICYWTFACFMFIWSYLFICSWHCVLFWVKVSLKKKNKSLYFNKKCFLLFKLSSTFYIYTLIFKISAYMMHLWPISSSLSISLSFMV